MSILNKEKMLLKQRKMTESPEGTSRMRTRSQDPKEKIITVEEKVQIEAKRKKAAITKAPFIKYPGKILYYTEFVDCAEKCEELLKLAEKNGEPLIIGFDIEWPFNFQTGAGKAAVVQISPDLEKCYVFQISALRSLPKTLTEFLVHPNVRITGINIKNDVRKLARDFKGFNLVVEKAINNCVDLGVLANTVTPFTQRWSMEKLVEYFFEMRISKDKAVRMSKWHVFPLTKPQQRYAALDAYASLKLYQEIKKQEGEMAKENENKDN